MGGYSHSICSVLRLLGPNALQLSISVPICARGKGGVLFLSLIFVNSVHLFGSLREALYACKTEVNVLLEMGMVNVIPGLGGVWLLET